MADTATDSQPDDVAAPSVESKAAANAAQPSPLPSSRRAQPDRRKRRVSMLDALTLRGRRRTHRRAGEGRNTYVDRPRPRVTALVVFILIACSLDAFLTLLAIDEGAEEANPLMRWLFEGGEGLFLVGKVAVTAIGVWILAVHQNFKVGIAGLYLIAGGYVALLIYHLVFLVLL